MKVDFSKCYDRCEGMDVISYDQNEIDSRMAQSMSKLYKKMFNTGFDKNPTLTSYISKLSYQYNRYTKSYNFPTKYRGNNQ